VGKTSSPHGMADKRLKLPELQLEGERRDDEVHLGRRDNKLGGVVSPEAEEGQQTREGEVNVPPTETTSPDVRRSARIRQPSKMMMESYQQQQESREQRGAKRRTEGEDGLDNRPAQRLRARLAQKENAR